MGTSTYIFTEHNNILFEFFLSDIFLYIMSDVFYLFDYFSNQIPGFCCYFITRIVLSYNHQTLFDSGEYIFFSF